MRKVRPEDCPKLNECPKVKMVLDKDLLDFQYAEAIRAVCANCSEVKGKGKQAINKKFITGAINVFPRYKLDDFLYQARWRLEWLCITGMTWAKYSSNEGL